MDTRELEKLGFDMSDPDVEEQALAVIYQQEHVHNYEAMARDSEEPTPVVEQTRNMSSM